MTRLSNVKLGVFTKCQNIKTLSKNKNMGQNHFKKLSKFQKFQSSNFFLTWSSKGKMNSVRLNTIYSKELQQKMKMLENVS